MSAARWIGFAAVLAAALLLAPDYSSRVARPPTPAPAERVTSAAPHTAPVTPETAAIDAVRAECRREYPEWSAKQVEACAEMRLEAGETGAR